MRFLIFTNELPRIADTSGALASRFVVWMQTESFLDDEDLELDAKLAHELPGILNWALKGLDMLTKKPRFRMPKASEEAMRMLEALGSPVSVFVREWCVVEGRKKVKVSDLFKAWELFCDEENMPPGAATSFGRYLSAVVPTVKKRGRGSTKHYHGIALADEAQERVDDAEAWRPNDVRRKREFKYRE